MSNGLDLDRLSPFAAMESMNMDENVSVSREPTDLAVENIARILCRVRGHKSGDEVITATDGEHPVWHMYRNDARNCYATGIIYSISTAPASPPSSVGEEASAAIVDIAAERRRQIEVEGWDAEHDAQHRPGELASAGACYARHMAACVSLGVHDDHYTSDTPPSGIPWPWEREWWKPKNPRRDLVRAAALIVAEIERLDSVAKP